MKIQPQFPIKKRKKPTQKQMALAFGVDKRTIRRWDKPQLYTKLGRKLKIQDQSLKVLHRYTLGSRKNTLTQQEITNRIYEEAGQRINQSTISRALKRKDITYKKGTKQFTEQDLKKARQFITDNYHLLSLPSLYALDECGFNLEAVPRYAYARKGQRAIIRRPGKRSPNHTLILCVQNVERGGVVHWKLIKGGTKAEDFHDFLNEINFPTDKENCLLLDNAKIHHANQACIKKNRLPIKELAKLKNIILKYLIAYSPQLNTAELCFNFIRQHIERCQARTEEKLRLAIEEAISLLQKQDLTQWFQHCWDNFNEKRKWNGRRKSYDMLKVMRILIPWARLNQIYPSQKWRGIGENPTTQDFITARRRVRKCVLTSLRLSGWENKGYTINMKRVPKSVPNQNTRLVSETLKLSI